MPLPMLLMLTGLLYILAVGGLSLLRREGLSLRFALEALGISVAVAGLAWLTRAAIHPVLLVVLIYLVTMRARLLADLGSFFARRGNFAQAEKVFALAERLWPDETSRLIVEINRGVLEMQAGSLDQAISQLQDVLAAGAKGGYLGLKHECACHYNLGVAYQRKGLDAQSVLAFNQVLETWPACEYARYASVALEKRRRKSATEGGKPPQTEM